MIQDLRRRIADTGGGLEAAPVGASTPPGQAHGRTMVETNGFLIVALFAIGMALSFLAADPRSPTSRPLALLFAFLGITFLVNICAYGHVLPVPANFWRRTFSLLEIGTLVAGQEWIVRIGRTATAVDAGTARGERLLRIAQGLACLYGVSGFVFPELRSEVWDVTWRFQSMLRPAYYLFAIPFTLSLTLASVRLVQLSRGQLDRSERLRLIGLSLATPFWVAGIYLPEAVKPVSFAIGEMIFLAAAIRYHVLQGQRAQFLARFLSPQLTRLVRERGLASTLHKSRVELSVVACDLRGFTAFSETAAPEDVMQLLEDYYGTVGAVVSEFGGSIKDFAGDGILALVGAPIPYEDHAARAVGMALKIRDRAHAILRHWRDLGLELGLGVGVASGFVTVGAVGNTERLEYAAIGPPVNLAARLCSRAEAGQVLADPRAVGLVGNARNGYRFEKIETAELKGFARPVSIFAVTSTDDR